MTDEFEPGVAVPVASGVRRITAPNGGPMTGPGTNTYLVGERDVAVIDPGPDDAGHLDAVAEAAAGRARWILVTHNHPDHTAGARSLARRLGLGVHAHPTPLAGIREEGFTPDHHLTDGQRIAGEGLALRCLHTPGHSADHVCFLLEDQGLLFAGDHVMEGVTVVIAPPDGDMAAYLESLRALQREPIEMLAPAHGALLDRPRQRLDEIIAHRLARESEILAMLAGQPRTVDGLTGAIYPTLAEPMRTVASWQVTAHLFKLQAEKKVTQGETDGVWQRVA
ncbi:MBL fold metallo-hydrolase [Spectribacter hydrogenooxidans]|uniref:MBL fold metallo-hydrolase n=1 Tax=Spectribacter hydrogenoxidans TaxID=3075608 RepID=A0ABU3C4G2_9GAMM|nr:MBL fold metallo-hydrolase [Salinisphaera sp. W335]MDT0636229.1 MBL fold metallo-hydrolase [Salinisphaera sp. W335]